ncbi:MAG: Ig-like domain-containing protein [Myxococcota bacterium]|nr:Ig-like domain-containing protein [Myxococcota bacterium]
MTRRNPTHQFRRTLTRTLTPIAALIMSLTGCGESSSTHANVPGGLDYSEICNPPCSPDFICNEDRRCVPDTDTLGMGGRRSDSRIDPTNDSGAAADATDMMVDAAEPDDPDTNTPRPVGDLADTPDMMVDAVEPDDPDAETPRDMSVIVGAIDMMVEAAEADDRDAETPRDMSAIVGAMDMMVDEASDIGARFDEQAGDACVDQECQSTCQDDCAMGESVCADDGRVVLVCGQFDPDSCLDWGNRLVCGEEQVCMDGQCIAQTLCDDMAECQADERRCRPEGIQRCSEVDGCLVWGPVVPCADGFHCQNDTCVDRAVDECPATGATACLGELLIECGQFDTDAALDWSAGERCPDGQSCSGGRCTDIAACADECQVDKRRCRGLGVEVCMDADADDCLEFGGFQACENDQSCSFGRCAADCQDECMVGETTCQFGALVVCGEFDGDVCTDWSIAVACPGDQLCVDVRCEDPADISPGPQPGPINIITPLAQANVTGTQSVTVEVPRHGNLQETSIQVNGEALLRSDIGGLLSTRWDTTTGSDGPATITVRVTRPGQDPWLQTREVIVDNTAPAITIEAPQANARHHSPFDVTARLEDQSGIADVRFLIDGMEFARTDEPPWTASIDPAQFQPWGPKILEVVVRDGVGLMARQSMSVHFEPAQFDLALVSPTMESPIARTFDFEVRAINEVPIESVRFEIDGQPIGEPVLAAPFKVTIDPANYAGVAHRLEAVAQTQAGAIGRLTLNVTWDQDPPRGRLLSPAQDTIITAAQEIVTFAFDVVDLDPQVSIRAFIGDDEIAVVHGPPYQVDITTDQVMGGTHDELIELRFVMSDYLGQTHTIHVPMVFSRADWSMRVPANETPIIQELDTADGAIVGTYDRIKNRGRVFRLGATDDPLSLDVSIPGGRPVQLIELPGQLSVGVVIERNDQHRTYLHINQGEVAWESDHGYITDVLPGPQNSVYLISTRPDEFSGHRGRLFGHSMDGDIFWEFAPSSPLPGLGNESVDWMASLDNGNVVVRTLAEDGTAHQYYGFSQAGVEFWRYDAQSTVAQNEIYGDRLFLARELVDPFDPDCTAGFGLDPCRALEFVSIDVNEGQRRWGQTLPENSDPQQFGFDADGNPYVISLSSFSSNGYINAYNGTTGELVYQRVFSNAFTPGEALSTPGGELAVVGLRWWTQDAENEFTSGIFRISADGGDIGGFRTMDETIGDIDGYGDNIVAALSAIGGGRDAVLMLDAAGESIWRTELQPGLVINRVHMYAPLRADVRVEEAATGRGMILPFRMDGTIDWRIDRSGASVSGFVGTANELYVTISDHDGVELLRIPRD